MLRGTATPVARVDHDVRVKVDRLDAAAYTIPTDLPESDGTLAWNKTTIVVVRVFAGGVEGLGYTYANRSAAVLVDEMLRHEVVGHNALDIPAAWNRMTRALRNLGRPGICSMAISAVDTALWD